MNRLLVYFSLILIIGFTSLAVSAQTSSAVDDTDLQSWDDISLTVAINKKVDLYFPATFRFDENLSRLHEGRAGAGVVLKPSKSFAVTPFYTFIRFRNAAGLFQTENRLTLRGVYRFPTKKFGLSHRTQFEYRNRSTGNLWRVRLSLTAEKELPEKIAPGLKVFVTEEPFYESASKRFSKNRLSFGINKAINKKFSLDLYYLRQDDTFGHPGLIHVIGTAWKIKL